MRLVNRGMLVTARVRVAGAGTHMGIMRMKPLRVRVRVTAAR